MLIAEEQELRGRTSGLALDWAQSRTPPFRGADKGEFIQVIGAAHVVADEARLALHRWVDAGRRAGMSWSELGESLGITKQAAQQRFRIATDPADGESSPDAIEVRLGATAFYEGRILREEGAKGNELIGTGVLKLVFRRSEGPWEHRRVDAIRPPIDAMAQDGWEYVSSWFPFHYFKRRAR